MSETQNNSNNNNSNNGGRGSSSGRGRGRNRGRGNTPKKKSKAESITGDCAELKNNVYMMADLSHANKYTNTTKAILAYITMQFPSPGEIVKALKDGKEYDWNQGLPDVPEEPTGDKVTVNDKLKYEAQLLRVKDQIRRLGTREETYNNNKLRAFALIKGQCTKQVQQKLEGRDDWEAIVDDPIKLLSAIKEVTHRFEQTKFPPLVITKAFKDFLI